MSEASKHTAIWREQKRKEGYQPVTVWIPGHIKELAVKLAFEQRHDLGVVVAEALQAHVLANEVEPSPVVDMRWVESMIDQKIERALAQQHVEIFPPISPAAALVPVSEGMKQCRKLQNSGSHEGNGGL